MRLAALAPNKRLGKSISDVFHVPVGVNYFRAFIARNELPDRGPGGTYEPLQLDDGHSAIALVGGLTTEVIRVVFWASYDGGTTWECAGHVGTVGGDIFMRQTGDLAIDTSYATHLREPQNRFRLFKVTIERGERLNTSVQVEFDTARPHHPADEHHSIAVGTPGSATGATGTTVTATLTCSGSERYLAAFAANDKYPTDRNITSLTYAGTGMTSKFTNDSAIWRNNGYELIAPSTTPASSLTVTWSAAPDSSMVAGVPFTGVDQTTASDAAPAATTGSGTTAGATITKGEDGDVRIALFTAGTVTDPTFTHGSGEVDRINGTVGAAPYVNSFLIETKEDNGTDDMNATLASGASWYVRGWNINQAGAAGAGAGPIFGGRAMGRGRILGGSALA